MGMDPKIGTREEWLVARKQLLEREKELTRLSDASVGVAVQVALTGEAGSRAVWGGNS